MIDFDLRSLSWFAMTKLSNASLLSPAKMYSSILHQFIARAADNHS